MCFNDTNYFTLTKVFSADNYLLLLLKEPLDSYNNWTDTFFSGEGARWDNFYKPASVDDDFCLLDAMVMLLADTVIHLLITWYIENVRPGNFGVPRPFYFPFTVS